jgi:hypothetical protein
VIAGARFSRHSGDRNVLVHSAAFVLAGSACGRCCRGGAATSASMASGMGCCWLPGWRVAGAWMLPSIGRRPAATVAAAATIAFAAASAIPDWPTAGHRHAMVGRGRGGWSACRR